MCAHLLSSTRACLVLGWRGCTDSLEITKFMQGSAVLALALHIALHAYAAAHVGTRACPWRVLSRALQRLTVCCPAWVSLCVGVCVCWCQFTVAKNILAVLMSFVLYPSLLAAYISVRLAKDQHWALTK